MSSRPAAAVGLLLALAGAAPAQPAQQYNRAVPPDRSALDRLNLRTEWATYLPVGGQLDALVSVQTFDDQLFAQTRTGLLIAVDARSGRVQWTRELGSGGATRVVPVAVNAEYVFAANVTRLFAFYRTSGVVEFTYDMGSTPTVGLAADNEAVYAVLTIRSGTAGAQRLVAYELPRPIVLPDATRTAPVGSSRAPRPTDPVDELARRYPTGGVARLRGEPEGEVITRRPDRDAVVAGLSGGVSPSLATLHRVTPPYTLESGEISPSLAVVPNLRRPYHLRDEANRDIQKTPSLAVSPSVGAALALTDLRPKGVAPKTRWEYGLTSRVLFTPLQSPLRLWLAEDNKTFAALSKQKKTTEVAGSLFDQVAARPGQAGTIAYVPESDGSMLAVDLTTGNLFGGLATPWRTNVGGYLNHDPYVTHDAVYPSGEVSGVARIDRATGRVVWRTADRNADRVVAANREFVYIRERNGQLQVYDAARATTADGRALPLTSLPIPAFNLPVVNTASDRVYLAADTGLLVCLRDASDQYKAPVRMAPEVLVNPPLRFEGARPPAVGDTAAPPPIADPPPPKLEPAKDPRPAPAVPPKADPPPAKKEPAKKEPPKKGSGGMGGD